MRPVVAQIWGEASFLATCGATVGKSVLKERLDCLSSPDFPPPRNLCLRSLIELGTQGSEVKWPGSGFLQKASHS